MKKSKSADSPILAVMNLSCPERDILPHTVQNKFENSVFADISKTPNNLCLNPFNPCNHINQTTDGRVRLLTDVSGYCLIRG